MAFTKPLLENALGIRPYNCEVASEMLLPKVAHCIPVLSLHHTGKSAAHVLKSSDQTKGQNFNNVCAVSPPATSHQYKPKSWEY